ncbi:MAG: hypothetical protein M1826_003581 [Phylliscum demangeonii]|nr:MAG: hypothetical protein M1826_003581 [Phylliscum demangeonii]
MRPSRSTTSAALLLLLSSATHFFAAALPLVPATSLATSLAKRSNSPPFFRTEGGGGGGGGGRAGSSSLSSARARYAWPPDEHETGGGIVDQVENWIRSDLFPTEYDAYLACIDEKLAANAAATAKAAADAHYFPPSTGQGLGDAALRLNCHTRIKSARTPPPPPSLALPAPSAPRHLREQLVEAAAARGALKANSKSRSRSAAESESLVGRPTQAPNPFAHLVPSWATRFMHAAVHQYQHRPRRSEAVAGKAAANAWPAGWPRVGPAAARREALFGVGEGAGVGVGGAL